MHVGMAAIFQNPGRHTTDYDVYKTDVRLAELAEPLGFASIRAVEHHFTDSTMCPDTIMANADRIGAEGYIGIFSYAAMPWDEAERNIRLFATDVVPMLQRRGTSGKIDWAA